MRFSSVRKAPLPGRGETSLVFSLSAETTNKEVHECQLGQEAISLFAEEKLDGASSIIPQRWQPGLSEDRENCTRAEEENIMLRNDSESGAEEGGGMNWLTPNVFSISNSYDSLTSNFVLQTRNGKSTDVAMFWKSLAVCSCHLVAFACIF